jgi:hypothetical protein
MDDQVKCPECGGTRLQSYGRTPAGKRKFRCLTPGADGDPRQGPCGRQFVWPQETGVPEETRTKIMALLASGTSVSVIHQVFPEVSVRWIYKQRRQP